MLDGAVRRGRIEAAPGEGLITERPAAFGEAAEHFTFESADGSEPIRIAFEDVRTICPHLKGDAETHANLRFFDAASIPSFLWVRLTFVDGELLEGMVENRLLAFSGPPLSLRIPNCHFGPMPVLVPRAAIADLQVITTR